MIAAAVKLTANERRALAELAKPVGRRDYSRVHGRTRHALERKGLFGSNGKPGGALTPAGNAALAGREIPGAIPADEDGRDQRTRQGGAMIFGEHMNADEQSITCTCGVTATVEVKDKFGSCGWFCRRCAERKRNELKRQEKLAKAIVRKNSQ